MVFGQYFHKKTLTDTTEAKGYNRYIAKTLRKDAIFETPNIPYNENTKCNVLNEIPASGSFSNDINFQILLYWP